MRSLFCSGLAVICATAVLATLSAQGPPPPRRLPPPGGTATQSVTQSIQGKQKQLGADNVIWWTLWTARTVHRSSGPFRVDPSLLATNGFPRIEEVLRRSPEILSFLQCDARLPDAPSQKMADLLCSRIVGK